MRPIRLWPSLVLFAGGVAATAAVGSAEPRRFGLEDLTHVVRLSEPQIAPDGRALVVLVSRVDETENRFRTELVLVDPRTGTERTLVHDRPGLASPRLSPAGDRLAFLAEAANGSQVHVLPMNGGEAVRVTSAPQGVLVFSWRPDGKEIAFTAPDAPEPRTGHERWNDAFEVGNNGYLVTGPPRPSHLWIVSTEGGAARRLTSGSWSLSTSLSASPLAWSPDARSIAFVRTVTPASGDTDTGRVHVVDVDTGAVRALTKQGAREAEPEFSPDGSRIVFAFPRDGDPANVREAYVAPASGGEGRSASRALDRSLAWARWMVDGRSLLVAANDGTRVGLWVQPQDGPARRVDLGPVVEASDIALGANGAIALVGTEADRPQELYLLESPSSPPRRLTDLNAGAAGLLLGRSEGIEWATSDGLRADGVVTYPPDFAPGRAWPLVLYIHGGPTAASNESFSELAQLMATRGWVVFQPNYRGSDNRGNAFQRAIAAGAGDGPGRDVMAGIEALERRGFVDATRIAVSGWSYGGFMTAWLIGRYPTGWRAAVAGAAALDLFDMYSLSDLSVQRRHAITGSPWTAGREEHYRAQSPLTYAAQVRTPTLLLSNTGDGRVAITQSYKLFHALKDNGVDTRFFAYPIPGHFPADPARQKDVYRRWLEWIEAHLPG
jgi:dipeptidyl aminopeptidase/acylaminoacyl peptidase